MTIHTDLWTVAGRLVRTHGLAAPAHAAAKADDLLARGVRSEAIAMRLLADACETLLNERPRNGRRPASGSTRSEAPLIGRCDPT
jgi:hypothetical protein